MNVEIGKGSNILNDKKNQKETDDLWDLMNLD